MKETTEKVIEMDVSYEVMQDVIESFYFGTQRLQEKFLKKEPIDLFGILEFVHSHVLQSLFKRVINLLILKNDPSDFRTVKRFANLYNDPDLDRLVTHLSGAARCKG